MNVLTHLLWYLSFSLLGSIAIFAQALNSSNSPILMLPTAKLAQGLDGNVQNVLVKNYHENYPDKFPEDLQQQLFDNANLTFLPNSDLTGIVSAINYDNETSTVLGVLRKSISSQMRTVIITKIDSKGSTIIEFKAKAINVLDNSIITEKGITFSTTEIDKVNQKINLLAKKMLEKEKDSILKRPEFWTAMLTVASAVWWGIENSKIGDRQTDYDAANTIGSVQTARAGVEDQIKKRNIAFGVTVGFATITGALKFL